MRCERCSAGRANATWGFQEAWVRRVEPKPLVPITKAMEEGNEPMRTFGDLIQYYEKKKSDDPSDKS